MTKRNLLFFVLLNVILSTVVYAVSIDAKANGALLFGGDRVQELHEIQAYKFANAVFQNFTFDYFYFIF